MKFIVFLLSVLLCLSCESPAQLSGKRSEYCQKQWLTLVYMGADNNLETEALASLNEMEASIDEEQMEILVLVDRSEGYDSSQGDWTGTRLYRIEEDSGGNNFNLVSENLSCPALGLDPSAGDQELNMGLRSILTCFVDYGMTNYPAVSTALIFWGHGSGWKSDTASAESSASYRSFISDDSDSDYLQTAEISAALTGINLDIIGFDTCNGAMIEVAYQLQDNAEFMVGSEDIISSQGWSYEDWLQLFFESDQTAQSYCSTLMESFSDQYASYTGATFSVIDLEEVEGVVSEINRFVSDQDAAASTSGDEEAYFAVLKSQILDDVENFYTTPGDYNIDVGHLADVVEGGSSTLLDAIDNAVVESFTSSSGNPNAKGLAIHLAPLSDSGGYLDHDDSYFKDRVSSYPLDFVQDCSWAIDEGNGEGFLYRMFW